ncbi:MAG: hypothetical protein SFU27_08705 [Thermonemataceae bacterium]|nr:hypothetical protein [Thermonemataceae bacterium]
MSENKIITEKEISDLKKVFKSDTINLIILLDVFLIGVGIITLEGFGGDVRILAPIVFLVAIMLSLYGVIRLKKRLQKDIEKGTFSIVEGEVTAAKRTSIKINGKNYSFSYAVTHNLRKGDKARLYIADASQTLFRIEPVIAPMPDVI